MRLILLPVLFLSWSAVAQDSLLFRRLIPHHTIKFSPNHLINFYPTLQLAYEARLANRVSVQVEGGYVLNYPMNEDTDYRNKRGAKTKLEFHYYVLPSERANLIYYGALEFYWNAVNFDRKNTQQECYDADCNHLYNRQFYYTVKYREPGFGLKLGFAKYIGRFMIDVNSGWIVRFIDYMDLYADANNTNNMGWTFFIVNEEDRVTASPVIGFRLGYRIR